MSALMVEGLTKKYDAFAAIQDVSFTCDQGEIFGLLGPNGAGKTTTIRTVATMLAPTSGTALVLGHDIKRESMEVRQNLGVLTTDIGVYERFSGKETLEYFGQLYGLDHQKLQQRIEFLSQLLQMQEFLNRPSGAYSTGMKQKLALARSMIHDPEVMILDEPTTGLDVLASQTVLHFMLHCKKAGKCVVFSTHNMLDADQLCDRVAVMHQGKIIALDTPNHLKQQTQTQNLADAFLKLVGQPKVEEL